QTGEVYVLLITNYANIVTNISFSQTGGAGSTNCGIIAPPITNNGPLCEGQTLQLTVSNPVAGATYMWSGPNSWSSTTMNPTITNVTTANAGTYSLVITVGTETSPPVTTDVVINPNVTPTFNAVGPYCSGASISALPTTSTNSISGSWSPAINNTATTTYTFTPSAGQCANTTTLGITINPNVTPTFTAVGPYCSGTSISALPTTSNNSVTGTWSPAINNTATTTYTFTPTAGQCAITTSMTINITPLTTPTFTAVGPYCSGSVISALPTTSNNGISGTWSPAINNTATTTYTFTPTAGQCANTTTMTITVNPNVIPTFTVPGPYCSGVSVPALPTTSTNGVTGTWSPAINNTATTTYTFTPSAGVCATSTTLTVYVNDNLVPSFDSVGPYCYGTTIPALPTTSLNGVSGTWSPAINNTATTVYTFTPGAGQCATSTSIMIEIGFLETEVISTTDQFCDALGIVTVSGVGGTEPYNYSWPSPATGTIGGTANNLPAGNYTVSISDAVGCQATQSFTIGFTDNMEATASVSSNPLCFGDANGTANLSITHGTGPYNVDWGINNAYTALTNYTINGLPQGSCIITVTDINGCNATASVTLSQPTQLIASATYTQIACSGESATVTVTATGGTPNYSGIGSFTVDAGTYNYTVTDSHSCQSVANVTVPVAPAPVSIYASVSNLSCFGASDGSISITTTGGTSPYYYQWSNFLPQSHITGLSAGQYSVTVTDYNECSVTGMYTIAEPEEIKLDFTSTDLSCYGEANGSVQMFAEGGHPPYTFEMYNDRYNGNGAYQRNLSEGYYTIYVRDANGCTKTRDILILSPAELQLSLVSTNPSCIGNDDGSVVVYVSGGTEPYTYVFDDIFFPDNNMTRLREGTYSLEIIDANNCN
ncbi:MAG: SprB repeat-containing protein, partial [Bacteroidales bacterium]|nr:SprB repeat-containing protein [Bacteroidales bacterium]